MTYHPELRAFRPRPRVGYGLRQTLASRDGLFEPGTAPTTCAYCYLPMMWEWVDKQIRLVDEGGFRIGEIDHIHPLCAGGQHLPENLVPACTGCNNYKRGDVFRESVCYRVRSEMGLSISLSIPLTTPLSEADSDLLTEQVGPDFYPVPTRPDPSPTTTRPEPVLSRKTFLVDPSLMSSGRERAPRVTEATA